jgi:hypothetical protein
VHRAPLRLARGLGLDTALAQFGGEGQMRQW